MTSISPRTGAKGEHPLLLPVAPAADLPPGSATPPSPMPPGEGGPHTRTALAAGAHHAELPGVGDSARPGPAGQRGEAPPAGPRVMGLDLSAESSGVALPDGTTLTIKAPKPRGKKRILLDDLDRLDNAEARIAELLRIYRPELVVIEDYAYSAGGSGAHRIGEIGGVVRLACHRAGAGIALVNTTHLKIYALGRANKVEKGDLRIAALKRAGVEPANDDECDGWWLRAMGRDHIGHPVLVMPEGHRAALTKVTWPELVSS